MTPNFTLLFLLAFVLTLAARLWLKLRHIRFIAAHRAAVPADFADRIPLAAHQKAADYTVDRNKSVIFTTLLDAALLLALTLGGGLAWLHGFWSVRLDGLSYGLAMMFSLMPVSYTHLADRGLLWPGRCRLFARHRHRTDLTPTRHRSNRLVALTGSAKSPAHAGGWPWPCRITDSALAAAFTPFRTIPFPRLAGDRTQATQNPLFLPRRWSLSRPCLLYTSRCV